MLKEIEKQLKIQNNRATANPIFVVYDWEKIPSCSDYTDEWEYIDAEDGVKIGNTKEDLLKFIKDADIEMPKDDKLNDMDGDELLNWLQEREYNIVKFYYIKKRVFRNVFFTEKSADKFMEQNKHHYTKEVHTYVHCLWRNPEMQYIRDCLKKGIFVEKESV